MTDRSIDAEIEANNRRKVEQEQANEDDGPIVDAFEDALDPITDAIERTGNDDDRASIEQRREGNDADQRSR